MIISDQHRYLFVELPHTGSTAISKELCENYGGQRILTKHARYHQFRRIATPEQKKYFVFSAVRNPLDEAVTLYFRFKTDHDGRYSKATERKQNGGSVSKHSLRRFEFVRAHKADFPAFLQRFYARPYDNWSTLDHRRFDYVIRYESLQADFAQVLDRLGIPQVRPLPVVNKTGGKNGDFTLYYPPEIRDHARKIFGPFMREWNYQFPPDWGNQPIPPASQLGFHLLRIVRRPYWKLFGKWLFD